MSINPRWSNFLVVVCLCLILALCCSTPTAAQVASTGSVAGLVTDPSGGVVVGATISLTDKSTNTSRIAVSNDAGRYFFSNVPPGSYQVSVNQTGFSIAKVDSLTITVGVSSTVDFKLEIGQTSQTVEVMATDAGLQTMNATVGNTVSGDLLQDLPSIQRDAATFVTLQPGVSPDGSVAGAVVDQSTFMLDGGQNSNDMDGSMTIYTQTFAGDPTGGIVANQIGGSPTGVMPTPLDSVEEFKVDTANQTADFNSSAGAEVKVVTKRGTNSWHGTGYEYYLDNNFSANTWDNKANPVDGKPAPQPSYHYNRFGAAVGGPIISKDILGGKTYFFGNYEGFRWNNSQTYEVPVPSANMRLGILTFGGVNYNLNTGTNCGPSGTAACDPRGLGINPLVKAFWNKFEPVGNDPSCNVLTGKYCDGVNEIGFKTNVTTPFSSNFAVARVDHDFSPKWHFTSSYRYYKLTRSTLNQVDVGGAFAGDTLGTGTALSVRPQQPWYYVAGLTTNISSNTTNDFHYSYLRNYWSWQDPGGIPQIAGLGAAVGGAAIEPMGESTIGCFSQAACPVTLGPYNVDTQSVRTRFWDGHDNFIRDDITMLKGNHLFTFGGAYERNWDYHERSDNGGGINYQATYQLGDSLGGGLVDFSSTTPAGVTAANWARDSAAVLGIVTDSQIAYTRSGSNLSLNPPLTHAFDQSTIPYYNVYFSDSWHMKPSITFTFGLGYTLEMPPTEAKGKQVELVGPDGQQLDVQAYLKQREDAALNGQAFNPNIGFALVGNAGSGQKYPYNPFYGAFSPRLAVAWSPNFDQGFLGSAVGHGKTVIRGGYSRIYGRLNGVDLVLVPLLGTGLIQAVQCGTNNMNGLCTGPVSVANAFRIGKDGVNAPIPAATPTLPQPVFPGINNASAAAGSALDPNFRPNTVDSFDFTIQRQITNKVLLEAGYIGRRITHEFQPININAVPYMMTLGGQRFDNAYASIETALGCATSFAACGASVPKPLLADGVTANPAYAAFFNALAIQPFFQTSLAGTGVCNGAYPGAGGTAFANCTAAVASKQLSNFENQRVWSLWSALDNGGFNFPRSMLNTPIPGSAFGGSGQLTSGVAVNASVGHGNYNGLFISTRVTQWKGITLNENFTWSKTLGTGALVQATSEYTPNDAFNLNNQYGLQGFDRKFVFNSYAMIEDLWYKSQQGIIGRLAGGWSLAPIFAVGSGAPIGCLDNTGAQAFGAGDGRNFFTAENCILTKAVGSGSSSLHANTGSNAGTIGFNIFSNADATLATLRPAILGLDTGTGGIGVFRGLSYWNVDLRLVKDIRIRERMGLQFQYVVTNLFNHPVFADPNASNFSQGVDPTSAGFGVVNSQGNNPRQMQFGLRFTF